VYINNPPLYYIHFDFLSIILLLFFVKFCILAELLLKKIPAFVNININKAISVIISPLLKIFKKLFYRKEEII